MKSLTLASMAGVLVGMTAMSAATAPSPPGNPPGETSSISSSAAIGRDASFQSPGTFLGFQTGEERRYVLGPPEELYADEVGIWTIRLVETHGDPPEGIFALTHIWNLGGGRRDLRVGAVVQVGSEGTLRVNRHGFPLELRFQTNRILAGYGEEAYTVRYRFQDGEFLKYIAADGTDLEHVAHVLPGEDRDFSVPIGIYPFVPTGVDCSRSLPLHPYSVMPAGTPRGTGSTASAPSAPQPVRFADNSMCREQLFGNPGLIGFMLPVMWEEATNEHEFVLLTPAGSFGIPGGSLSVGSAGMNVGGGGSFDHRTAIHPRTNSAVETLRYVERTRVEVGQRSEDAWLFDGIRALEAVYVDDDGVVLRVDLDTAAWYGLSLNGGGVGFDPSELDARDLWVRLLYPSEY